MFRGFSSYENYRIGLMQLDRTSSATGKTCSAVSALSLQGLPNLGRERSGERGGTTHSHLLLFSNHHVCSKKY